MWAQALLACRKSRKKMRRKYRRKYLLEKNFIRRATPFEFEKANSPAFPCEPPSVLAPAQDSGRRGRKPLVPNRLFRHCGASGKGLRGGAANTRRMRRRRCGAGFVSLPKKPQKNAAPISAEISFGKKILSGARRRPNTRHICKQPYTASYNTAAYAPARSRGDSPLNRRINYLERRNINTAPITAPFEPRIGVEFSDTRILPPLLQSNSARLPKP